MRRSSERSPKIQPRNGDALLAHGRRLLEQMLTRNLVEGTHKRPGAGQQFVRHHRQGVLIAATERTPPKLFRRSVEDRALEIYGVRYEAIRNGSGTKVVEDDLVLRTQ